MRSARQSSFGSGVENNAAKVDPRRRRRTHDNESINESADESARKSADESVPEALVPDVIQTETQQPAPELSQTRWSRIARRAYELAQQRGFAPGAELSDWLQAEQEIDAAELERQAAPENQNTG